MKNIEKNVKDIKITVDYRTELLGVIMLISKYHSNFPQLFGKYGNEEYINNIMDRFSKYKDETTIKLFEELLLRHPWFGYDSPINLFLQLDNNFKCSKLNDYIFNEILEQDRLVYDFIDGLDDFAKKINFEQFYLANQKNYENYIESVANIIEETDLMLFLKEFYGYTNNKKFNINLLPFLTGGGYNVTLENNIYSCMPTFVNSTKNNLFIPNKIFILSLCAHEWSHGYVDEITENQKLVDNNTTLFDDIKEQFAQHGYPTDKEILNEHIICGIQYIFLRDYIKNEQLANDHLNNNRELGFKYIDCIVDSLSEYTTHRDKYKTFSEYYPKIIENIINYKNNKNIR